MSNVKLTQADRNFYAAIKKILEEQQLSKEARPVYKNGQKANSFYINGYFSSYDLSKGDFPITTLRPIAWKSAIKEILWIYQEQTNSLDVLQEKYGVNYWNAWKVDGKSANNGDLNSIGNRYGYVVKKHKIIDKIIKQLEENPWNRRNVINLWDYESFEETEGLYPCAFLTMFDVRTVDGETVLDCTLVQRSNDMLVAHHINAIQYVALQLMLACHFNWKVGKFNYFVNNLHIYDNQLEQAEELLNRYDELETSYLDEISQELAKKLLKNNPDWVKEQDNSFDEKLTLINALVKEGVADSLTGEHELDKKCPKLQLTCPSGTNFYDIRFEDFELLNYDPIKPQIKFDDLAI